MIAYVLTIFLGAFLLFQVQPIIGKYILPWFGGMPAVWTTCMLFFQSVLLGGYAYAHLMHKIRSPRRQVAIHLGLLALSAGLLLWQTLAWTAPILPGKELQPVDAGHPIGRILLLLTVGVGLPYLLLASTSPLLQTWFHRVYPAKPVYRLYMVSNVGSMLALISYPFVIEPWLGLTGQATVWSGIYVAFVLGCVGIAVRVMRAKERKEASPSSGADSDPGILEEPSVPGWSRYLMWLGLTASASALMIAVTNEMCQEVAVIPFLWILPLAIYLFSFILTFDSERWYARKIFGPFLVIAVFLLMAMFAIGLGVKVPFQIAIYSLCLFVCCMVCHGELVRMKPAPRYLTSFYLMVSLGGASGGAFVALLAPVLFDGYWELHVALFVTVGLFVLVLVRDKGSWLHGRLATLKRTALAVGVLGFGVALAWQVVQFRKNIETSRRNFYGVLRVAEEAKHLPKLRYMALYHGKIIHGLQLVDPERRNLPTCYFAEGTGVGMALSLHPKREVGSGSLRVGVVGLGIGTLAAYGREGDHFRFFEINPLSGDFANGLGGYFSFIKDSPADTEILYGDGRLLLERERKQNQPEKYDVLVVDAFSSDSIPVHLLTVEAFSLYRDRLAPDGILAVHVSNGYLDPAKVVLRQAAHLGMPAIDAINQFRVPLQARAHWVLVTFNEAFLGRMREKDAGEIHWPDPARKDYPVSLWTDNFSNLVEILR